eukprot:913535-Rhodomonas_salina.1
MGDKLPVVEVGASPFALSMAAGNYHTCALLDDMGLKCWGQNNQGKLGIGESANKGGRKNTMGDNLPEVLVRLCIGDECDMYFRYCTHTSSAATVVFEGKLGTWTEAEAECKTYGGHLASVASAAENDLVYKLYVISGARDGYDAMWLGFSDDPSLIKAAEENKWAWSDGSEASYTSWDAGQPDNWEGEGGQNCGL